VLIDDREPVDQMLTHQALHLADLGERVHGHHFARAHLFDFRDRGIEFGGNHSHRDVAVGEHSRDSPPGHRPRTQIRHTTTMCDYGESEKMAEERENTSFGPVKEVEAGVLDVGYVEVAPSDGPPVMLLHGWPFDIHSYAEVAPGTGGSWLPRRGPASTRSRHDALRL
jgi:hypothetical protein